MEPIGAVWSSPKGQISGRNLHDDLDLPDFEALMAQAAKQGTTQ